MSDEHVGGDAHVALNAVLHCRDCSKPVNIASSGNGPVVTCRCGKTMPANQFDAAVVKIDPAAPDAWGYGDPNE